MERSPWDPDAVVELALDTAGRLRQQKISSNLDLERCYEVMYAARKVDACLGQLGVPAWASGAGEEAVASCIGLALTEPAEQSSDSADSAEKDKPVHGRGDRVFPGRRDLGLAIALGRPLSELLRSEIAPYHGGVARIDAAANHEARDPRLDKVRRELGLDLLLATGHARAQKIAASENEARRALTLVSFGEGLTTHGSFHEALAIAASADLPLVLVCKSQAWPEGAPAEAGILGDNVADRARACGIWTRRVDGADCVGVHMQLTRALQRAREGHGPALLDIAVTPLRHRPPGHRDPIERLRLHLHRRGVWSDEYAKQLDRRIADLLQPGLDELREAGFPVPEDLELNQLSHSTVVPLRVGGQPESPAVNGAHADLDDEAAIRPTKRRIGAAQVVDGETSELSDSEALPT